MTVSVTHDHVDCGWSRTVLYEAHTALSAAFGRIRRHYITSLPGADCGGRSRLRQEPSCLPAVCSRSRRVVTASSLGRGRFPGSGFRCCTRAWDDPRAGHHGGRAWVSGLVFTRRFNCLTRPALSQGCRHDKPQVDAPEFQATADHPPTPAREQYAVVRAIFKPCPHKVAGTVIDRLEKEVDMLNRHLQVLWLVIESEPIGIVKIADETGFPHHKVRYSLRVLEEESLVEPSNQGATTTAETERFVESLDEEIDHFLHALDDMKIDAIAEVEA